MIITLSKIINKTDYEYTLLFSDQEELSGKETINKLMFSIKNQNFYSYSIQPQTTRPIELPLFYLYNLQLSFGGIKSYKIYLFTKNKIDNENKVTIFKLDFLPRVGQSSRTVDEWGARVLLQNLHTETTIFDEEAPFVNFIDPNFKQYLAKVTITLDGEDLEHSFADIDVKTEYKEE